jgi:hypothetical protein
MSLHFGSVDPAGATLLFPDTASVETVRTSLTYREARSAVLYGVTHRGFDGPDGLSKDEALELAAALIIALGGESQDTSGDAS